jgi:hypothetical protein
LSAGCRCRRAPLAQLGLARAYILAGDTAKARAAYQDFFALWKDADQDIPLLLAAKSEYAKLKLRAALSSTALRPYPPKPGRALLADSVFPKFPGPGNAYLVGHSIAF